MVESLCADLLGRVVDLEEKNREQAEALSQQQKERPTTKRQTVTMAKWATQMTDMESRVRALEASALLSPGADTSATPADPQV